ncbi:MAG: hypothetical protein LR008_01995 [Candidatus Pacebacteria bacterium]|nr:hypothetical protein [Candidatus Paceibacterota bacterium]
MNKLKIKLFIGAFAALLILPSTTHAYFTTEQSVVKITDDTVLFTVTYSFGIPGRELYMPIGAIRSNNGQTPSPYLEYNIIGDKETTFTAGTAGSLVFTNDKDVEIRNNQYYLPASESADFTLVSLVTIPKESQTQNLSLLVTSLPFTMVVDGNSYNNNLNPSELQYYRTPEAKF